MRAACVLVMSVLVFDPSVVRAQSGTPSFSVEAAAGPTLVDAGHSLSAAFAYSVLPRVTLLADVQQTQLYSRSTRHDRGASHFRGGTMTAVSGEVRVHLRPAHRVTPYLLAGLGAGVSRPTVNEVFPDRVSNRARFTFAGAGVWVPLRERLSLFGDARVLIGTEAGEMLAVIPLRVGMAWRF